MSAFLGWIRDRVPELAFIVAGLAAISGGIVMLLHLAVPTFVTTVLTLFVGLALQTWTARAREQHDDDEPPAPKGRRRKTAHKA